MAFREVTMLEIKEVPLLWLSGVAKKAIARQVGFRPQHRPQLHQGRDQVRLR